MLQTQKMAVFIYNCIIFSPQFLYRKGFHLKAFKTRN